MKKCHKKFLLLIAALLLIVVAIGVWVPMFNFFVTVTPQTELIARAVGLEITLASHVDRKGSYPQSLNELVDGRSFPASALTYPDIYVLPEGTHEIPEKQYTLQWIYLPPDTSGDDVPVLIAPLPFISSSAPEEPWRLVVFRDRGTRKIREKEMPEIWAAALRRPMDEPGEE